MDALSFKVNKGYGVTSMNEIGEVNSVRFVTGLTTTFITMLALGSKLYTNLSVHNKYTGDIRLRVTSPQGTSYEIPVYQSEAVVLNDFWHTGTVSIAAVTGSPTGSCILRSY